LAAPTHANGDVQPWTAVSATGPAKGELALWVEGQLRAGTGISRVTQRNLRGSLDGSRILLFSA